MIPTDNDIAEQNIERLLGAAYKPETADPVFAQTVTEYLCSVAKELAEKQPGQPASDAHRYRALRRRLGWGMAAAACVAICGLVIYARNHPGRQIVDAPKGENSENGVTWPKPSSEREAASGGLMARPRPAGPEVKPLGVGERLTTKAGERRRLTLADGSILYLNQSTEVTQTAARRLLLTKGEVYLEVAQGSGNFVVKTPAQEVAALGTHFAVQASEAGTGVVVTQGKVEINGKLIQTGQQIEAGDSNIQPAPRASHLLDWTKPLMTAADARLVPASKHAGGALLAIDPNGQEVQLSLRKYHIDVHIEDGFARTTIDQTYFNNEWSRLEGTFYFPLPADATQSRLAMYVEENGQCRLMEGGMAEREHARNVFETIMHTRRDPALLEWVDGTTFKMRVFPLEGRKEKRIILSYTQRLSDLYGSTRYRFPGGSNMALVREWSFQATIRNGAKLNLAAEPNMTITKVGKNAVLTARATDIKPDRDVSIEMRSVEGTLRVPSKSSEIGTRKDGTRSVPTIKSRFSEFTHEKAKYLMVRFRPELAGKAQRQRRDWVIMFESSANRDPLIARAQIDLVRYLLLNAEHDDTFVLLTANTRVHAFDQKARPATPKNIDDAVKFLESTHLIGALDLDNALKTARPFLESVENPHLVHVGAGLASLGEHRDEVLINRLPERTRYIGLGVGKRWNRSFMKLAAERTAGYYRQVNPDESLAWHGFDLLSTLNTPRLLDVRVADKAGKAMFLSETTMLSQGEEICAITRLDEHANLPKHITVTGKVDGKRFSQTLEVRNIAGDAGYLPRAWAKLELDRLQADGAEKNKQRIIELSKASYVMSPFTSLLVLETDADYERFKVDRGRKDHWAMYPCPDRIPIVYEPGNQVVQQAPAVKDDGRRPVAEVLQTILVRALPSVLRHPQESYTFGSHCLNVGDLYSGAYGLVNVPDGGMVFLGGLRPARTTHRVWQFNGDRAETIEFQLDDDGNTLSSRTIRNENRLEQLLAAKLISKEKSEAIPELEGLFFRPMNKSRLGNVDKLIRDQKRFISFDRIWTDEYSNLSRILDGTSNTLIFGERFKKTVAKDTGLGAELPLPLGLGGFGQGGAIEAPFPLGQPLAGTFYGRSGATRERMLDFYRSDAWVADDGKRMQFTPMFLNPTMRWSVPDGWMKEQGAFKEKKSLEDWDEFGLVDLALKKRIDIDSKWRRMQRPDSLLYYRPIFTGDQALFSDLTIYAPGLNTTAADIQAILQAEAKVTSPIQGTIDPAAKVLIDKARSAGWQTIRTPAGITIQANGAGHHNYERLLWSGLLEKVICDGKTLLHLYPEIGLGSKRQLSQFHRAASAGLVPWSLAAVEDLARGADIKAISANIVAVMPANLGQNTSSKTNSSHKTLHLHLVFADNGRLRERRIVLMPSKKTVYREVYRPGGTVVWFDSKDEQLGELKLIARPGQAPGLKPDTANLVLVPMPLRTPDTYYGKITKAGRDFKADGDLAVGTVASNCWQQNWAGARQDFQQRFESSGDRRLGFYALLAGAGDRPKAKDQNAKEPLYRYLATMPQPTQPSLPRDSVDIGPKNSFLQRLATIRELWLFFGSDQANSDPGAFGKENLDPKNKETPKDKVRFERQRRLLAKRADAIEFLQDCPAPFAFALLATMEDGTRNNPYSQSQFLHQLRQQYGRLADEPGLGYAARYEEARCLLNAGNRAESKPVFEKLYADMRKDGALPIIDSVFVSGLEATAYGNLIRQTSAELIKEKRFAAVLTLAWQNSQLGQHELANDLVSTVLSRVSGWQKPLITLGAIDFLMHNNKLAQADSALQSLLADEKLAAHSGLWRLGADLAKRRGITSRAVLCLEKALDMEYRELPEVINLKKVREDYTSLLTHYHQLAVALTAIETEPPKNFVARVVRAADRWRVLDGDSTQACQLAAKTLQAIGARDLAWDYLTTPIAQKPNESGPWLDLARAMVESDFDVADRAYALAYKAEPTNAQILWDHAQCLHQHSRGTQAQQLYRQLTEGDWQPRFQNLREQARLKLER